MDTPALAQAADLLLEARAQIDRIALGVTVSPVVPVKPGFQTSEFWLTVIHAVGSLLAASGAIPGFTDPTARDVTLGTAGLSAALYIWSRIKAKAA
jgi:hypothetical protein